MNKNSSILPIPITLCIGRQGEGIVINLPTVEQDHPLGAENIEDNMIQKIFIKGITQEISIMIEIALSDKLQDGQRDYIAKILSLQIQDLDEEQIMKLHPYFKHRKNPKNKIAYRIGIICKKGTIHTYSKST